MTQHRTPSSGSVRYPANPCPRPYRSTRAVPAPARDPHPQKHSQQSPNDPLPRTARPGGYRELPGPVAPGLLEPVVLHCHAARPIAADARPSRRPASHVMGRDPAPVGRAGQAGTGSRIQAAPARCPEWRCWAATRTEPEALRDGTDCRLRQGGVRDHPGGLRAHGGAAGDAVSVAFSIGPSGRYASTHRLKSKLPRFGTPRPQRCGVERGGTASSADGTLGPPRWDSLIGGRPRGPSLPLSRRCLCPLGPRVVPLATRSTSSVRTSRGASTRWRASPGPRSAPPAAPGMRDCTARA